MNEKLIRNIKKGKREAFKTLFEQYFNTLCAFGYKYLNDITLSEDFVQEAFVSFWQNRDNFDEINAIKSFLYTTVRNKCLNLIKHQEVKQKHEQNLIEFQESEQFFADNVIEEEVFNQLYSEIRKLPEASMNVMLLALNGLKNPEIAEELNISVNTVKTQKKIAYAKLKSNLSPLMQGVLLCLSML